MTRASVSAIRVLIADDHAVVREGIRHVLSADEGFHVVGEAANGADAVSLARTLQPDVVVLDISMPVLSGLDATRRIRDEIPEASILVLSIHEHEEYVLQSVRAGAHGYLRKDSSPAELRDAIRAVYEGSTFFSAPVARSLSAALQNERRIAQLTSRERDVLVEIASGRTNKEIAGLLGISVRTVESHRESLMKKLDVHGVAALTRFAIDNGLLSV
jgi:two-component system nitrate/nitrite response regulator NarL